jgi:GTP cyclohydrolase FolE2
MKQKINATKMITMAIFALCTIGSSHPALASVKMNDPIELKYVGTTNTQPVFQLNLNNTDISEYFISIKDANNTVIYTEKLKGANLSRKYRFEINEFDLSSPSFGITVEVTSAKTHKTEEFHVKSITHTVNNYEVAKL